MAHLTTLDKLKEHITLLTSMEESEAPFISCYLNLEDGETSWRKALDERACILRRILKGTDLADLEESLDKIEAYLATELLPEAKGLALFVRSTVGGGCMLPMQFAAPLPDWLAVYPTPNIYHLIVTLSSFIKHQEQESESVAKRLTDGLRGQNLAVAGSAATLDALHRREVDTLVMARDYQPDPGWTCRSCKAIGTEMPETSMCLQCGDKSVWPLDVREALLRLAGQLECPVEVVEQSDVLMSLGGVGGLLRTRLGVPAAQVVEPAQSPPQPQHPVASESGVACSRSTALPGPRSGFGYPHGHGHVCPA